MTVDRTYHPDFTPPDRVSATENLLSTTSESSTWIGEGDGYVVEGLKRLETGGLVRLAQEVNLPESHVKLLSDLGRKGHRLCYGGALAGGTPSSGPGSSR